MPHPGSTDDRRDGAGRRPPGPRRFFTPAQEPALRALCAIVLATPDDPLASVPEAVDRRLADRPTSDDGAVWRLVLDGLDHTARRRHHAADFAGCARPEQFAIVADLLEGRLRGGPWDRLDVPRAWSVVLREVLGASWHRSAPDPDGDG